ncbi:MAG: DegV family protein [Bacilli bacterium]|nr:DegV family protein [Bacilli bacterium]
MAIKLVIDSSCDINLEEANKLGITLIPMEIRFNDEVFYDGVDLLPKAFYEKLIENSDLPKTSQINPFRFEEVFEKLTNEGNEVIAITISSKLSGTYNSAVQAASNFNNNVRVIDSLNASIGERLIILYTLDLIKQGKSIDEIVNLVNENKSRVVVLAMLDTLKYLRKGGRISSLKAIGGELLSIKPVVTVKDGEVKLAGKARGSKNGNNLLNKLILETGGVDFTMPYGTVYSGFDDSMIKKYIEDNRHLWEKSTNYIPNYILGCTIGTHIGPGAIGVAFFKK